MAKIDFQSAGSSNAPAPNEDWLRAKCWKQNQWARSIGFERWWHVRTIDRDGEKTLVVEGKDGDEAARIRKLFDGWYPDYMNWPADKLESEFRILRHIARMGMPEELFRQTGLGRGRVRHAA